MSILGSWIKNIMEALNPDSSSAWDEYRRARLLEDAEKAEANR